MAALKNYFHVELHGLSEGGSPGKFFKKKKKNTAAACSLIF
jgi:hypothetical protein